MYTRRTTLGSRMPVGPTRSDADEDPLADRHSRNRSRRDVHALKRFSTVIHAKFPVRMYAGPAEQGKTPHRLTISVTEGTAVVDTRTVSVLQQYGAKTDEPVLLVRGARRRVSPGGVARVRPRPERRIRLRHVRARRHGPRALDHGAQRR